MDEWKENESIRYYNLTFSISELINQIAQERIVLDKDKYRNLVWDLHKQSLLIDSIYRDFPTPSIYLYENKNRDGALTVIDGIQRLRTIYSFCNNQFEINCLKSKIHGKRFDDLNAANKRKFLMGRVSITVVEDIWNSTEIITELFYRLNTGAESLTNQEYRNRMFFGSMINSINSLNFNELWRDMYNNPVDIRYKDSEYLLGFFTYVSGNVYYKRSITEDMNEFIQFNRNNDVVAEECEKVFIEALSEIHSTLGEEALLFNGRFSSTIFYAFVIPLGILIRKRRDYNIKLAYEQLLLSLWNKRIQHKSPKLKIKLGLRFLAGDDYDF